MCSLALSRLTTNNFLYKEGFSEYRSEYIWITRMLPAGHQLYNILVRRVKYRTVPCGSGVINLKGCKTPPVFIALFEESPYSICGRKKNVLTPGTSMFISMFLRKIGFTDSPRFLQMT